MEDKREQAQRLYEQGRSLKDIAAELGTKEATVRQWKRRGKWDGDCHVTDGVSRDKEASRKRQARANRAIAEHVENNDELTDLEKEFCIHFVQCYNISQAAQRLKYYSTPDSARQNGWRMMQKPAVQAEIKRLKAIKRSALLADVDDLVELHMRIAFADAKDFVAWTYDPKHRSNRMAVMPSENVDGQLVKEVSESAQGFKIKFQDKKGSMDFLERFFLANPLDKHKVEYDKKRLELEKAKLAEDDGPLPDDGFRAALNGEVWADGDDTPSQA